MDLLSQRNPPSGAVEMTTVTSDLMLLCNMRCMFIFMSNLVCVLSQKEEFVRLFPFLPCGALWRPLIFCMPCLVRLYLISFLKELRM